MSEDSQLTPDPVPPPVPDCPDWCQDLSTGHDDWDGRRPSDGLWVRSHTADSRYVSLISRETSTDDGVVSRSPIKLVVYTNEDAMTVADAELLLTDLRTCIRRARAIEAPRVTPQRDGRTGCPSWCEQSHPYDQTDSTSGSVSRGHRMRVSDLVTVDADETTNAGGSTTMAPAVVWIDQDIATDELTADVADELAEHLRIAAVWCRRIAKLAAEATR